VVQQLNAVLAAALDDQPTRTFLEKQGIVRAPSTEAAYLSKFMAAEIPKWRKVVESVGIEPQ
jgi:hypothetical protein